MDDDGQLAVCVKLDHCTLTNELISKHHHYTKTLGQKSLLDLSDFEFSEFLTSFLKGLEQSSCSLPVCPRQAGKFALHAHWDNILQHKNVCHFQPELRS